MTDDELLRYLGTTDDHIRLTVLVRLERSGAEAIIGTLDGPNAWVPTWPPDGLAYASVPTEAMIGLLGPAARAVARAAGHECNGPYTERCPEADDIIAAWVGIDDTEVNGELFAARGRDARGAVPHPATRVAPRLGRGGGLAAGDRDGRHQPGLDLRDPPSGTRQRDRLAHRRRQRRLRTAGRAARAQPERTSRPRRLISCRAQAPGGRRALQQAVSARRLWRSLRSSSPRPWRRRGGGRRRPGCGRRGGRTAATAATPLRGPTGWRGTGPHRRRCWT